MIDRKEFLSDLRTMKKNCLKNPTYEPVNDLANLIAKHNLDERLLWKIIKQIVYQQAP